MIRNLSIALVFVVLVACVGGPRSNRLNDTLAKDTKATLEAPVTLTLPVGTQFAGANGAVGAVSEPVTVTFPKGTTIVLPAGTEIVGGWGPWLAGAGVLAALALTVLTWVEFNRWHDSRKKSAPQAKRRRKRKARTPKLPKDG